jgi:protoporphyrinogen oxidase
MTGIRSQNEKWSVAIIGAGPAGMTAASKIIQSGLAVEVFEAARQVGGLARTINLWGRRVDLGPHRFFSKDKRVNQVWLDAVGDRYDMVDRLTRIYYNGQFFSYPLRPFETFSKLGAVETARCLLSYVKAQMSPAPEDASFERWVVDAFGQRLFDIFFKTYSEKLWGIPCSDLDADFAAQRIKKFTLQEAIVGAIDRRSRAKHVTLVDRFAYPHEGTGYAYERMAQQVRSNGGEVWLERPAKRVVVSAGEVEGLELADGTFVPSKRVISTMPLTLLVERLDGVPAPVLQAALSLEFRNTILVYLLLQPEDLFPDNWIYVHSDSLETGRVTNFRNWSPRLHGDARGSVLSMEYWANDGDELWLRADADLVALASDEIVRSGLAQAGQVLEGRVHRIRRCYPVYRRGYRRHIDVIREYLSSIRGLQVIGRYGSFKYNNQDHSILMGLLAAENVTGGAGHDLWSVNSDYSTYQEEALITESGLTPAGAAE